MAKSQNPPSFARFSSRFGLSKSQSHTPGPASAPLSSSSSRSRNAAKKEDEWYIPYNGPYEPPPVQPRSAPPAGERDSWGDIVQPLSARFRLEDEPDSPHDPDFSHGQLRPRANTYASASTSPPSSSSSSQSVLHKGLREEPKSGSRMMPNATSGPSRRRSPAPRATDTAGGIGAAPVPALRAAHSRSDHPARQTHSHSRSHSGNNNRSNSNTFTPRHPAVSERGTHTHSVLSSNSHRTGAATTDYTSGSSPPAAVSLFSGAASGPGTRDSSSLATTVLGTHRLSLASLFSTFGARQRVSQPERDRGKDRYSQHEKEWVKEKTRERSNSGGKRQKWRGEGSEDSEKDNQAGRLRNHPYNIEFPSRPSEEGAVIEITDLARGPPTDAKPLPRGLRPGPEENTTGWDVSKEEVAPGLSLASGGGGPDTLSVTPDADAYYNSFYGTLLTTPSSTRPSTLMNVSPKEIPPVPNLPPDVTGANPEEEGANRSPRLGLGPISRRREPNSSDADRPEVDEEPRGRSRYNVHPYANPRAFTFPSQEPVAPEGSHPTGKGVDGAGTLDPTVLAGSRDRTARPPRLTFTAPSQRSSPAVGFKGGSHQPLMADLPSRSDNESDGSYSRTHAGRSPPVTAPVLPSVHDGSHPDPHRHVSPGSPLRSLQQLGARLKASMSTPNLRSTSSLSTYSASSSAAGTGMPGSRIGGRTRFKEKEKHRREHVAIADGTTATPSLSARVAVRPVLVRGLDRWLSPETWCDALLLPKPRLRVREDGAYMSDYKYPLDAYAARGVSPPGSPIAARDYALMLANAGPDGPFPSSLESRVLAHARSVADFRSPAEDGSSVDDEQQHFGHSLASGVTAAGRARVATMPSQASGSMSQRPSVEQNGGAVGQSSSPSKQQGSKSLGKAPRRKSFALDDLALLSPVPSLTRVLAEGEILEHQRRKWQQQAQRSFQNQRSRSLSRARTHKLKKDRPKGQEDPPRPSTVTDADDDEWLWPRRQQGPFEFLVARSLLGNQDALPVARKRTLSAGTHSHSNSYTHTDSMGRPSLSLAKTSSKSDRTHSRTHSRNDSWRMKIAKNTAAICGGGAENNVLLTPPEDGPTMAAGGFLATVTAADGSRGDGSGTVSSARPADKGLALEGILHGDSTQVIRLADPVLLPRASPSPSWGGSASDNHAGVGIALTTSYDDLDPASIRIPAHPYAQTVAYPYQPTIPEVAEQPHKPNGATSHVPVGPLVVGAAAQSPTRHPYARHGAEGSNGSENRIIGHPQPDSHVPPQDTMWAPVETNVVREVLPDDIQYSPFITSGEHVIKAQPAPRTVALRNSHMIYDMVGVGETLARAVQEGVRGNGVGAAEDYNVLAAQHNLRRKPDAPISVNGARTSVAGTSSSRGTNREPVQYDASRPSYRLVSTKSSDPKSNHTLALSLPEHDVASDLSAPVGDLSQEGLEPVQDGTVSPGMTSESSSPRPSPLRWGQVDDFERFHDLFFRPDTAKIQALKSNADAILPASPPSGSAPGWEPGPLRHRTASSGLTSLARQLTEELEELQEMREAHVREGQGSEDTGSRYSDTRSRDTMQFMLSEVSPPASPTTIQTIADLHTTRTDQGTLLPFRPSDAIPEDVSRASSPTEEQPNLDEDLTERFRMGFVEAVPTPPSTMDDRRFSEHLAYVHSHLPETPVTLNTADPSRAVSNASLQPPSTLAARSSYMTTSDTSRMSGLSDFPVPPSQDQMTPGHMSIINSYFEERRGTAPQLPSGSRSTDEVDFAMALSSRPPQARHDNAQ